jgi:BR-signaling kinase
MGCLHSKTANLPSSDDPSAPNKPESVNGDQVDQEIQNFKEFELNELRKATNGFSPSCIVSEGGEKAPNVVYRGKLEGNHLVAIKRFSRQSWPDAQQFVVRYLRKGQCMICCSLIHCLILDPG